MRFFKELFNPKLKCIRVGHNYINVSREGFAKTVDHRWYVADEVTQARTECSRCGIILNDWFTVKRKGLNGLTMPSRAHDELDATGFTRGY